MSDKSKKAADAAAGAQEAPSDLPEPSDAFDAALAAHMESLASAGDLRGGLEVIKFLRMYIQDMPITEYRSTGWPKAVADFLAARGLAVSKDYTVTRSSLDPASHVFAFEMTARSKRFLNELAGLRRAKGPSAMDLTYCELTKTPQDGRDFAAALAKPGTTGGARKSVKVEVARSTAKVLKTVAAATRTDWFTEEDDALVEFARSQLVGDELKPSAVPVVPAAVAELYARLTGAVPEHEGSVFRLMPDVPKSAAARPLAQTASTPYSAFATTPFALLDKCVSGMSSYMARDVGSFLAGGVDNGVVVAASTLFRTPGRTPEEEIRVFRTATDMLEAATRLEKVYSACYCGDLFVSFCGRSNLCVPCRADGTGDGGAAANVVDDDGESVDPDEFGPNLEALCRYLDGKANEEVLGGEPTDEDPRIVMTACLYISPFRPENNASDLHAKNSRPVGVSSVRLLDGSEEEPSGFDAAKAWFETVHGFLADPETDDEKALTAKSYSTREDGSLTTAAALSGEFASELRKFIVQATSVSSRAAEAVSGLKQYQKREGADQRGGLHDESRWIPQVISLVPDAGVSLGLFAEKSASGRSKAPHFLLNTSENAELVDELLDRAFRSGAETTAPSGVPKSFVAAFETNINYEMLRKVADATSESRLFSALIRAFFRALSARKGFSAGMDRLRTAPEGSAMKKMVRVVDYYLGVSSEPDFEMGVLCGLRCDSYGRAVVFVSVPAYVGVGLIDAICGDRYDARSYAAKIDPSSVVLAADGWQKELGRILYENRLLKTPSGKSSGCLLLPLGAWLACETWNGGEVGMDTVDFCVNLREPSAAFSYMAQQSHAEISPD